ncbi:MAG: XRE family transcriptional regulator [Oscillospiraceae bacterium]
MEDVDQGALRQELTNRLFHIATGSVNDAVKLAFIAPEPGAWAELEGLDLTALSEFKRNSAGSVEMKLVDRVAVLEKLLELQGADGAGAEAFLKALEGEG